MGSVTSNLWSATDHLGSVTSNLGSASGNLRNVYLFVLLLTIYIYILLEFRVLHTWTLNKTALLLCVVFTCIYQAINSRRVGFIILSLKLIDRQMDTFLRGGGSLVGC